VSVVELGTAITAPLAGVLLSDLGADVVKIERPEGDLFRTLGGTKNHYFSAFNRGKRSVVLDLALSDAQQSLRSLICEADVFLDNVRPGSLARLGVDPDELRRLNPGLVHCSITGFGATGPYSQRPAFDGVAQALSGLLSLSMDADDPGVSGPTVSDNATGMYACIAILGALAGREAAGGRGARIEVNMLEASMAFIGGQFASAMQTGVAPGPLTRVAGSQAYAVRCADGPAIAIHLSGLEKFWTALVGALNAPELLDDPRFSSASDRTHHYLELRDELAARFARDDRATWEHRLTDADVPFAPVYDVLEVIDDPQVRALDTVYRAQHEDGGLDAGVRPPYLIDGRRPGERREVPELGADTDAVLARARSHPDGAR